MYRARHRHAVLTSTLLKSPVAFILAAAACAAPMPTRSAGGAAQDPARLAGTVLTGRDIESFATVLDAMAVRVPNIRVARGSDCPGIALRSARVSNESTSPLVYLNGVRSEGTCLLVDVYPGDVERVEVYPLGATTRPGYARSSNGLILIFTKSR